jgi:NADH-quinone oxidoreductase subunit N
MPCIAVAAVGSLLWGAFAALHERKITRFLGYASINQIGYLLLGLVADSDAALVSAYYYLILYAVMTGGFLLAVNNFRRSDNRNFTFISDFRGLGKVDNLVC